MMGDSQLSDPGFGPPVDALDTACKRYKDCLRCVMTMHGDLCVKEYTKYELGNASNGYCGGNQDESCERALCECDLQFGWYCNLSLGTYRAIFGFKPRKQQWLIKIILFNFKYLNTLDSLRKSMRKRPNQLTIMGYQFSILILIICFGRPLDGSQR